MMFLGKKIDIDLVFKKPSIFRHISSFGTTKRMPHTEQTAQITIRKRANASIDARNDLETKIGRLSRRLNFITFEHYAEKLNTEAGGLITLEDW
jgi:hypothetical protein